MIIVGVRDLKNQLSRYLQYVKDGENVVVTEHNRIIAEIHRPLEKEKLSPVEEKMLKLQKEGSIYPAKRKKSFVKLPKIEEKLDWESLYFETGPEQK